MYISSPRSHAYICCLKTNTQSQILSNAPSRFPFCVYYMSIGNRLFNQSTPCWDSVSRDCTITMYNNCGLLQTLQASVYMRFLERASFSPRPLLHQCAAGDDGAVCASHESVSLSLYVDVCQIADCSINRLTRKKRLVLFRAPKRRRVYGQFSRHSRAEWNVTTSEDVICTLRVY